MIISKPGKITERIVLLGREESNVYLLDGGTEYALIGGGMIHITPDVADWISESGVDGRKIRKLMILHSHFDHVGIIPYFKRKWPWAEVCASERAALLLETPRVVDSIRSLNKMLIDKWNMGDIAESMNLFEFDIKVEKILSDGNELPCGDLTMRILEVPGHSSCSAAVYVPELKALFASDAGGFPLGEKVFTAANSNFDQYMESLERMSKLDIELFLPEHYGAVAGDDAKTFFERSKASAAETRTLLERILAETGDVEAAANQATDKFMTESLTGAMPREIVHMVVRQMLKYLFKKASGHT